ncbi:hypothetical Protein YC6258_05132 [Gynuella sunshinyii YC6258]|uniref:Uncharacterized protein n=1 Tax=Gynuella sunshinyii YC6258 TaxID=1445510 RepID=A0A0C5VR88_9GAMM|nr:hypothetical Protein YC6258_05132 [Gynuella sunshinyii YC6258]
MWQIADFNLSHRDHRNVDADSEICLGTRTDGFQAGAVEKHLCNSYL